VLPVVSLGPPRSMEEMNIRLLQAIERLQPQGSIENVDTNLSSLTSESIVIVDVNVLRTQFHVVLPLASRRMTFLSWPPGLQQLDVRINKQDGQVIDVLSDGHEIIRNQGIERLFITTSPAIPGGVIRILLGEMLISGRKSPFGYERTCPLPFEFAGGQSTGVDIATFEPFSGPLRLGFQSDRTSTANVITNIPSHTVIRISGNCTSEDETVPGSKPNFNVRLIKGGNNMWQQEFDGMIGGAQLWPFDTGWGWLAEDDATFSLVITSVGPVGNVISMSGAIEIIPNIPTPA